MSIQTELTRITNAKAAIKTAIEGKGVTVPDGTLLGGMASLIESIEAGGGGGTEELSALLKIFGCSDYEISVVQQVDDAHYNMRMYVPITNENLKSSLRLIFIPGTNSLFPTNIIKKAPILRAPSAQPVYGFFAYMPPFVSLRNDKNTIVALQHNGVVDSYSYKTSNSFTQDTLGFVFENNTLTINLYYLCSLTDVNLDSMIGKKVLLMGGNVQ